MWYKYEHNDFYNLFLPLAHDCDLRPAIWVDRSATESVDEAKQQK